MAGTAIRPDAVVTSPPSLEASAARIAVAFERIAQALEDGRAVSAPPPAQAAKPVTPDR